MANFPCPISNPCLDAANPVTNYSAEEPDAEVFISRSYGVQQDPPLGGIWTASSCVGMVMSTVSQADANAKAQQANIVCLSVVWPEREPNPNDPTIPVVPRPIFSNDAQSCDFTCADGSAFTFTIPAGTVFAFSQVAANDQAHSMACNGAITNLICIGELGQSAACVDEYYEQSVGINVKNIPIAVGIISGSLPPGLILSNTSMEFTLFGFPTVFGTYSFLVRVSDSKGMIQEKNFTIYVIEILQDSLANGTVGNNYSETLTAAGPTLGTVTWAVTSGFLPPGLSLDSATGIISGIPTSQGTATFTISMTDER